MNTNSISITSFVSQLAKEKQLFPKKQLSQFCKSKNSTCTPQKYKNIFESYQYQFKKTYRNFQQIVLISSISLLKNQSCLIQYILEFIQDLITSKMILICVNNQQVKVYEKFNYLQRLFSILIPVMLKTKMEKQIMNLFKKCNQQGQKYITINFLLQFYLIQNILNYVSKDSASKFQKFLRKTLLKEKLNVLEKHWKNQTSKKVLKLTDLVYLRKDIQDYKVYNLILQKGALKSEICKSEPPNWVIQAYKKNITTRDIVFQVTKNTKIMEIYKFLIQLQVLLSSPKIQEVEQIIPNSEFIQRIFSNFLQGTQIYQRQYKYSGHQMSQYVNEVRNKYQSFPQPYKEILRIELQKLDPKFRQKQQSSTNPPKKEK